MRKRYVYYAYLDLENNRTELLDLHTGVVDTFDGFDVSKHINSSRNTDCYISSVSAFAALFPGGEFTAPEYAKHEIKEPLLYHYGKCTYRSFFALFGGQRVECVKKMYDTPYITVAMHEFLCMFGDPESVVIKYTLAYQAQKMFFAGIADELWKEHKQNKHYYYDVETYRDMYAGNKSGTMLIWGNKASYHENINAWDKKSAYPSVMVNDDVFPIGRVKQVDTVDAEYYILDKLQNKKWVKIVFDGKVSGLDRWYDADMDITALEYWNFWTCYRLDLWEALTDAIKNKVYRLYACTITGYLNESFRGRIVEYFEAKEVYEKGTIERFLSKTMIDMLYGKGIQELHFRDINELQKHYRGRGKYYLTPEFSMHCVARLEYEVLDATVINNGKYCDTDGVKVPDTDSTNEYFETKNNEIIERNNKAGFSCNIGVWDNEGHIDRLLIFARKCYVAETDGQINATLAGVPESTKDICFDKMGNDKMQEMREKGFDYPVKAYRIENGKVVCGYRSNEDGTILFNHLRGDLEHE